MILIHGLFLPTWKSQSHEAEWEEKVRAQCQDASILGFFLEGPENIQTPPDDPEVSMARCFYHQWQQTSLESTRIVHQDPRDAERKAALASIQAATSGSTAPLGSG